MDRPSLLPTPFLLSEGCLGSMGWGLRPPGIGDDADGGGDPVLGPLLQVSGGQSAHR